MRSVHSQIRATGRSRNEGRVWGQHQAFKGTGELLGRGKSRLSGTPPTRCRRCLRMKIMYRHPFGESYSLGVKTRYHNKNFLKEPMIIVFPHLFPSLVWNWRRNLQASCLVPAQPLLHRLMCSGPAICLRAGPHFALRVPLITVIWWWRTYLSPSQTVWNSFNWICPDREGAVNSLILLS